MRLHGYPRPSGPGIGLALGLTASLVVLGALGARGISAAPTGATACTWHELSANVPRAQHVLVALPAGENMAFSFGGLADVDAESAVSEAFRLSLGLESSTWSALSPSGEGPDPSARLAAALRERPLGSEIVTYGGDNGQPMILGHPTAHRPASPAVPLGQTHALSPLGTWRTIDTGAAPVRMEHAAVYWPSRDWLLSFGGMTDDGFFYAVTSDTLRLALGTDPHDWVPLITAGDVPSARWGHSLVYDPLLDQIVLYGGCADDGTALADVWTLSLGGDIPTWAQLQPTGAAPPGRYDHVSAFLADARLMVVFGGTSDGTQPLGDTRFLDLGASPPAWVTIPVEGAPAARFGAAATALGQWMILNGGQGQSGLMADTWLLSCTQQEATTTASPTATTPAPTGTPLPTDTATPGTGTPPAQLDLRGLVYDSVGGPAMPIAGARVRVPPCQTPHQSFEGTSGADGRYVVTLPGPYFGYGCNVLVEVSAPGYTASNFQFPYADLVADPNRDFALQRVLTATATGTAEPTTPVPTETPTPPTPTAAPSDVALHGYVWNGSEFRTYPIVGAQVRVTPCQTPHQAFVAVSDASGAYALTLPAPYFFPGCVVRIEVAADGFATNVLFLPFDDLAVEPERNFYLKAVVPTPATPLPVIELGGLVYDASVGLSKPVPYAQIEAWDCLSVHPMDFGQAGADGRYSLTLNRPYSGSCQIRIGVYRTGYWKLNFTASADDLIAQPGRDFGLYPRAVIRVFLPFLQRRLD